MENCNTEGRIFSATRFGKLAKYELIVRKSSYIKLAIAALGVFIAMAILVSMPAIANINEIKELGRDSYELQSLQIAAWTTYMGVSMWMFCIGLTIVGSLTFSSMSSKKGRITTLMVPASIFEKYLLRFLVYIIGGTLLLAIGVMLGMAILQLSVGGLSISFESFKEFISQGDHVVLGCAIIVLMVIFGNSLYALGSSIWPKLSWIKTWIVVAVLEWVVALPMMFGLFSGFDFTRLDDMVSWSGFLWCSFTLLILLNAACWVGAWYRFRNTQIVQRFMTK